MTRRILDSTLQEIASTSYEKTTISNISRRSQTSKQAIYRRWKDKARLVADALKAGLAASPPAPPQRGSVAQDLKVCLTHLVEAMQETPLGEALRSVIPLRDDAHLRAVLAEAEDERRLHMRQILIATPFETDMETRIDLLLGLIYFRLLTRGIRIEARDIDSAIQLVLGLTPPKDPPRASVPEP
ncbi:TetR/AcrR family transcriptional regulator [Roseibium sp. CAU 1637]|uniref:TetR/AcrR family transcriptional regulator n=1 Tax=Roseibium limicola TaxID=2816037 RepID=A0A939J8C3_9HYPH|nr:TetR/AcrR family transcriptional regulator [Roseibium limicola]MBO0344724.1 TetR/AcrR family transcriptional regulator [Roseibium limicola]